MGARGFFGGLFGDVNSAQGDTVPEMQSGIYSLDDQYYSKQEGGWTVPLTGTVTGGTVVTGVTIDGSPYNIHQFQHPNSKTLVIAGPPTAGAINQIDITVVGGGGGGGGYQLSYGGGGGGGGGVRHAQDVQLLDGTYPISVGDGGAGAPSGSSGPPTNSGQAGEASSFNPGDANSFPALTASGGGFGGIAGQRGGPGGSGGGKSYPNDPGSPSLGNAGGDDPRCTPPAEGYDTMYAPMSRPTGSSYRCGGGGGSGGTLSVIPLPADDAYMKGANGLGVSRLGEPGDPWLPPAGKYFGGGGGGSSYKESNGNGEGGLGGGGVGGNPGTHGGITNTGGGGGGAGQSPDTAGTGGEGIVYVRVPGANTSNPG